jgi:hypothetical protein
MLALTNQQNPARDKRAVRLAPEKRPSRSKAIVLTTKDSYFWATFLALVAERRPETDPETLARQLEVAIRKSQMVERVSERLGGEAPNSSLGLNVFSYASDALGVQLPSEQLMAETERGYRGW